MSTTKRIRTFGDIASFVSGNRPQGGVGQIKNGALSLGGEHVGIDGKLALSTPKYVPMEYFTSNPKGHITNGDILLCKDGALSGKVALERGELSGLPSMVNEHVFIIRTDKLDQKYLFYYLFSPVGQRLLKGIVTGAAQGGINGKNLKSIPVVYPESIGEQHRIVSELDLLTGILDKKNAQLRDLDALAQSIFYELFGDPAVNEKGWDIIPLGRLCEITSSKRIYANEYVEGGIPFFRGKEVSEKSKGNSISVELFISPTRYSELKEKFGVPQKGDLLITAVGTIGNIWEVDNEQPFYFKDGNVLWIRSLKDVNSTYFKYLLSFLVKQFKQQMVNGCAYNALTIVNLKEMPTNSIPISLQNAFADRIQLIERQKSQIKASLAATHSLLNCRMDNLFNV